MFVFTVGAIDELVETAEDFGTASVWAVAAGCTATIQHWPLTRPQPPPCTKSTAEVKIYPSRLIQ
jgi:hypothetical protein